jgi:hypothetical protein
MDQTQDPYDVPGISRNVVKKLIVMAIGIEGAPSKWPDGFKSELLELGEQPMPCNLTCPAAWKAVVKVHPVLQKLKKGMLGWAELQYNESRMLMATIVELMDAMGSSLCQFMIASLSQSLRRTLGWKFSSATSRWSVV